MLIIALVAMSVGKLDVSFPPIRLTRVEYGLELSSRGHKWLFETRLLRNYKLDAGKHIDRFVQATCDGKLMWREEVGIDKPKHLPYGNFMKFSKPKVKAPWPVIVIRGHYGLGSHWDTYFYTVNGANLGLLGRPPAINSNGPINYKARRNLWLFDDYDVYEQRNRKKPPISYVLYSLDAPNKMRKIKSWKSDGKRLRDSVGLSKW